MKYNNVFLVDYLVSKGLKRKPSYIKCSDTGYNWTYNGIEIFCEKHYENVATKELEIEIECQENEILLFPIWEYCRLSLVDSIEKIHRVLNMVFPKEFKYNQLAFRMVEDGQPFRAINNVLLEAWEIIERKDVNHYINFSEDYDWFSYEADSISKKMYIESIQMALEILQKQF